MKLLVVSGMALAIAVSSLWAQEPAPASQGSEPAPAEHRGYIDPDESLFHRQPLPDGPISLIGGTVQDIDRVQNRIKVKVIGGGTREISFDDRTRVLRDGEAITYDKIRIGDRVYVDTLLYEQDVFARSVRILTNLGQADARGQIKQYDPRSGTMTVVDELSSDGVTFTVDSETQVTAKDRPAHVSDLIPGALVTVKFVPGKQQQGVAREVSILAKPGGKFVFAGAVTNVDLRLRKLSIANKTDGKTYDLNFEPDALRDLNRLKVGSEVMITAVFGTDGYRAEDIDIISSQAGNK